METYLSSLGYKAWKSVENDYTIPSRGPSTPDEEKAYESNANSKNFILSSVTNDILVKVMHCQSAKKVWDKLNNVYKGNDKIKEAKFQTLRENFESLKMSKEEKIEEYLLRVDETVNVMRGLGETVDEPIVVKKVLRSLPSRYDSKVSVVEEAKDIKKFTLDELHGTFTTCEMRTRNEVFTSKETTFKTIKQEKLVDTDFEISDEEELNIVGRLKKGLYKYKGKLPFKCFNCSKVGHFAAKYA
ncbi:uncharacterized protein LOC131073209 [Cryptomeria japonica]|uniref:uncharacterized protein LOC131073209 n=1 Tax=Cryptomeria japonica TaxID=3369 RepID=UPI0025AC499C|nr:uncharacterized protein LOC131073209 [Cryptomeria japonica]